MNLNKPANWQTAFKDYMQRYAACFQRQESRESAKLYVRGLLADKIERKNCWQVAEALGLEHPKPLQRLLNESDWDADALVAQQCALLIDVLGSPGIGVIDESGFVKKGDQSAGVNRQYCGRLGKVENCQVGVFLAYVSPLGQGFLDRRLYLPKVWCEDKARCKAAKIPAEIRFKTKPEIALDLLETSWQAAVPMQWVVADTAYGNSADLRAAIHEQGRYYVMELGRQHQVLLADERLSLDAAYASIGPEDWFVVSHQLGEKGPLQEAWAQRRVTMPNDKIGEQWLLIRWRLADDDLSFLLCNAPLATPLEDMIIVAGARHGIEALLEEAKDHLGMADYEVRYWPAWLGYGRRPVAFSDHLIVI